MKTCERCQPLFLDHLYGLLDGPDAAFVEAHLRDCAACATARDEAARVAGLLAQAARGAFPQVRFVAPASEPARPSEPAKPAAASAGRSMRVGAWLPWAVAAAVWLAIPGTVLPVLNLLHRADRTHADAEQATAQLAPRIAEADKARLAIDEPRSAARRDLAAKSQHLDAVLAKWLSTESETLARDRRAPVDVLKPASLQPGAPNDLGMFVREGLTGGHTQLTAEIHEVRGTGAERTDAVILSQPLKAHHYEAQPLRLPASAWAKLTPQSELYLAVTCTDERTRAKTEVQERVRLFGPVFTTMLATDKPSYRPGETLFFRSLTLDRITFRPPDQEQNLQFELSERAPVLRLGRKLAGGGTDLVRVVGGKVEPVLVNGKPIRGVGCGSFVLPDDLPDGDYNLVLRELPLSPTSPPIVPTTTVRPIKVHSTPSDIHKKNIVILGSSFAPGDVVHGYAELTFEGRPVAGAEVQAIATADNILIDSIQEQPKTGPDGRVNLLFTLPQQLDRGDVRLQVTFKSTVGREVVQELVTDRVPVVGRQVKVEFFPEGGELVAGAPCRVYVRATTPDGQPVDIRGTITDGRKTIATVATLTDAVEGANRGLGSFTITPEIDRQVWLKLDAPAGMSAPLIPPDSRTFPAAPISVGGGLAMAATARTGFLLPAALEQGVVMTVLDPVTTPGQPIRVHLRTMGASRKLVVGAYTRSRLSDSRPVTVEPNQVKEVTLMANADPRGGVVRITVFEDLGHPSDAAANGPRPDLKPVAERLVFRKPGDLLNLGFSTTGEQTPGSPIELNIAATDEKGNPAAAILYAAAVNSGVRAGQKDRLLTTHFLLAGEVTNPDAMEFADFLLTDHPRAAEVLDVVLATQGWRRFAEQIPAGYLRRPTAPTEESRNLLVSNGQYSVWTDPAVIREQRKLNETFWPQYEKAKSARDAAKAALAAANADRSAEDRAQALTEEVEAAHAESRARRAQADAAAATVDRFRHAAWYGVAGFGLLALLLGATGFLRPDVRLPLGVGTAGSLGLVAFLVFALGSSERTQAASVPMTQAEEGRASDKKKPEDAPAEASAPAPDANAATLAAGAMPMMKSELAGSGLALPKESKPAGLGPAAPSRGVGPRKVMVFGGGFRAPILPTVEAAQPEGMMGTMRFGMGVPGGPNGPLGGGMGGGYGGFGKPHELGFFEQWHHYFLKPTEPAPPAPALVPAPPGGVSPLNVARGGAGLGGGKNYMVPKSGALVRRSTTFPEIALGGRPASGTASGPAAPTTPGIAMAQPKRNMAPHVTQGATIHQRGSGNKTIIETDRARMLSVLKDYADLRAELLSDQLLAHMAREQAVPLELLKESLELAKKGNGAQAFDVKGPALPAKEYRAYNRILQSTFRPQPLVVREYAAPRPGSDSAAETPDTILWQPVIVLPGDGKAKVAFHLGNAPGGYQVVVAGHTLDGRLGATRGFIPVTPVQPTESATPTVRPGQTPPVPPSGPRR